MKNLVLKISVLVIILLLLSTAAGCAASSSADAPETSAQDEVSQSSENPEPVESTAPDEPSESPDKDVDPVGEDESNKDALPDEKAEQSARAGELGLMVVDGSIAAPVFVLPTLEGSEITLSDLRGRFVVLNFWATHCPPCVAEMKYFEAAAKEYPDELTILAVDIRETESKLNEFFGDNERTFTVPMDTTGEVASVYGIRYTPTTLFIDTEGNIPYAKIGAFASQQHFEDSVALLLELG